MKILIQFLAFLATIATISATAAVNFSDYESNLVFMTWNSQGANMNFTFDNNASFLQMCGSSPNWTMVSHAWNEDYKSEAWPKSIVQSFLKFRGGCVIFMDYGIYSRLGYGLMVTHFQGMVSVIIRKFQQLEQLGFKPGNGFLFAYGFSSHMWFTGAYNYSPCTIGRIDSCDAAKPQYLNNSAPVQAARRSAKFVNCYHTSVGYGTDLRYCQKDIDFGRCGLYQPSSVKTGYTDHQMCPYLYNNSFTIDFDIVAKSVVEKYYLTKCFNSTVVPQLQVNEAIHVGPRMKMCIPHGEYYVITTSKYPYNLPSNYTA